MALSYIMSSQQLHSLVYSMTTSQKQSKPNSKLVRLLRLCIWLVHLTNHCHSHHLKVWPINCYRIKTDFCKPFNMHLMCIQKIEEGQDLRDKIMYRRKIRSFFKYSVLWCDQIQLGGGVIKYQNRHWWNIYIGIYIMKLIYICSVITDNDTICTCLQLQGTCIDNANQAWYASILFANGQFRTNTCKDRSCYMHIYF